QNSSPCSLDPRLCSSTAAPFCFSVTPSHCLSFGVQDSSRLIQKNRRIYYSVNPSSTKLKANGQWLIAGLLTAVCLIFKESTSKLPYWLKSNQSITFCVANQLRIRTMAQRAKAGVSNHVRS